MAFDFDMIKKVYSNIVKNVDEAKKIVNKPLTLSEKILYSHLWNSTSKHLLEVKIMSILNQTE